MLLLATLVAGGCRGVGRAVAPAPAASPTSAGMRVGVVDLDAVSRAHPRWAELDALHKKIRETEAALAVPPQVSPVVQARLQAQLKAQGKKLEAEFSAEMRALRERQQEQLNRYGAQVKAQEQANANRQRLQVRAEFSAAVEERAKALRAELRQYESQVMEEYRFPIANLRLKADVVGVANEEELRRLSEELERLLTERDAKVRERAEVLDVALVDFRKAKEAEANARLERIRREADAELRRLVTARERELRAETERLGKARQRDFERRLSTFRQQLLGIGEAQLASAQRSYLSGLRQQEEQLRAQRQALEEQRLRLEDAILADVKIEVASIAAARGYDVVLTRFLANIGGEDITADVLARMKR